MNLEKYILAAITTNPKKVPSGAAVFHCESKSELETVAANLEAILDGIAHELTEELYVIVKH
ncbi:capping complex subunit for YIEGIA [Bacillus sp. 2205SS5-2]|uniref:capping complex subunit for YIEGIA n=1 Tax=Bacillus sp. 2205SS5-2 TaxID=3109031 RepID=UPI0030073BAB